MRIASHEVSHDARDVPDSASNQHTALSVCSRLHSTSAGRRKIEPTASPIAPASMRVIVRWLANHGELYASDCESVSESARKTAASGASFSTFADTPRHMHAMSPSSKVMACCRVFIVSTGCKATVATHEAAKAAEKAARPECCVAPSKDSSIKARGVRARAGKEEEEAEVGAAASRKWRLAPEWPRRAWSGVERGRGCIVCGLLCTGAATIAAAAVIGSSSIA